LTTVRTHKLSFVVVVMADLCFILAGCGAKMEITYKVEGPKSEVDIEYQDASGKLEKITVTPPWEKPFTVGSKFDFEVNVTNKSGAGAVGCLVMVDGRGIGDSIAGLRAGCSGYVSKDGGSTSSSFQGKREGTINPAGGGTPAAGAAAPAPNAGTHSPQGMIYYEAGQYDQAIIEFKKAIELEPGNAVHHRRLGTIYMAQEDYEAAVGAYQQGRQTQSELWGSLWRPGGRLYRTGQTPRGC
jgi:tetratricopeptide (TPR) repeat protein